MQKEISILHKTNNNIQWAIVAAITAVLAIGIAGTLLFRSGKFDTLLHKPATITQEELEAKTGVQVSLIAVTAAGGFIDFRIKVFDAEKANQFFGNPDNLPLLAAEDGDTNLTLSAAEEYETEFEADRVYFLLYANTQNAIQRGTPVTVIIGDMHLESIIAQ